MNPSLLLIPDRYKKDKLYSQIPDSGAGDLTFARNSNATRVNSAGLIEKVRTNLLTYSNTFSDASWTKIASTVTQGATDPFGGSTAWTFQSTSAGTNQFSVAITGTNTLSIYAKAGNISIFSIWIGSAVTFNLATGLVTAGTGLMENAGNGWYRCIVPFTVAGSFNPFINSSASGENILIAFAQQETGDIATDYIPTTTAAVSVGITADIPRLDYTGGGCPSLLLEPQRTNKWFFSEQFDNAEWLKSNVTFTANAAVSPDGFTNADKMVDTTANDEHRIRATGSLFTITTATTFSIFAKAAEYSKFAIADLTNARTVKFNLSTGSVISTGEDWSNAKIENYGNGWYRLSATNSSNVTVGYALLNDAGDFIFTGTGTKGVFIYGAQAEEAAYPTSYIPTLGSSVTRLADTYQKGGFGNTSTAGTLYYEFEATKIDSPNGQYLISLFAGSSVGGAFFADGNAITICGNGPQIQSFNNGYGQLLFTNTPAVGANVKIAIRYDGTNVVAFVNGVNGTVFADTAVGVKNAIRVNNGENSTQATRTIAFYPVALSDAEAIQLTTL
jgi:hypothetical protein